MFGGVPSPLLPHLCVQEVQGFQSTAQVEQLLLEHGERVVDRLGTEIDPGGDQDKGGGGAVSDSHTHSVYTCLYSLYRSTPLMCVMLTWRLSDDGDYFNL